MTSATTTNPFYFLCRKWGICIHRKFANCAEDNGLDGTPKVALCRLDAERIRQVNTLEEADAEMQQGWNKGSGSRRH